MRKVDNRIKRQAAALECKKREQDHADSIKSRRLAQELDEAYGKAVAPLQSKKKKSLNKVPLIL